MTIRPTLRVAYHLVLRLGYNIVQTFHFSTLPVHNGIKPFKPISLAWFHFIVIDFLSIGVEIKHGYLITHQVQQINLDAMLNHSVNDDTLSQWWHIWFWLSISQNSSKNCIVGMLLTCPIGSYEHREPNSLKAISEQQHDYKMNGAYPTNT